MNKDTHGKTKEIFPQQVKESIKNGNIRPLDSSSVSNSSDTSYSTNSSGVSVTPSTVSRAIGDKRSPCPYDHLVLVVHGIGKHDKSWDVNIKRINKLFNRIFYSVEQENFEKRVKFIGTEWHSTIHNHLGSTINDVTPSVGIPAVRQMVDNTVMDFLMFSTPSYADPIYKEVSDQMNNAYKNFMIEYPNFSGKVSILAHSLGSIITYDILTNQPIDDGEIQCSDIEIGDEASTTPVPSRKLQCSSTKCREHGNVSIWKKLANYDERDREVYHPCITFSPLQFPVYNFYLIGSPVGALLSLRKHKQVPIPRCTNIYNIYNIYDPVSYLVEPLIDKRFLQQDIYYLPKFGKKLNKLPKKFRKTKKINTLIENTASTPSLPSVCLLSAEQQFHEVSIVTQTNITNLALSPTPQPDHAEIFVQQNNKNSKVEEESSSSSDDDDDDSDGHIEEEEKEVPHKNQKRTPIPNLFGGVRFDYALKPKGFHISAYTPMFTAHSSYWLSKEVLSFIGINLNIK